MHERTDGGALTLHPLPSAHDLQVMGRLAAAGYRVITSADVFPEELRGLDREMRALVEYFVGLEANKWVRGWSWGEGWTVPACVPGVAGRPSSG